MLGAPSWLMNCCIETEGKVCKVASKCKPVSRERNLTCSTKFYDPTPVFADAGAAKSYEPFLWDFLMALTFSGTLPVSKYICQSVTIL
jgi:hypothetical protein